MVLHIVEKYLACESFSTFERRQRAVMTKIYLGIRKSQFLKKHREDA